MAAEERQDTANYPSPHKAEEEETAEDRAIKAWYSIGVEDLLSVVGLGIAAVILFLVLYTVGKLVF
jgi:hypothetical protein